LAFSGDARRAQGLAVELGKRYPHHTPLHGVSLPSILGTIEMQRGNPARAIELLQPAIRYDLSEFSTLAAMYIRGLAYLRAGSGKEAAAEFQKILDHSGLAPTSPRHPLARLGQARAYALGRNTAESRQAYNAFFAAWKDADADIPILQQARKEYAELKPN
jgi:tetratricopeptide (TPR) repeat protein